MSDRKSMGVVGLGVMGSNLALNVAEKGYDVAAYDPWEEARSRFSTSLSTVEARRIVLVENTAALVNALPEPRTILIMVKAGEPVDAVIADLVPVLRPGDTLIDGGNSHYQDTINREAALNAKGFYFIGLGISGGEEGARHGPSLMAGGAETAYANSRPILEAIAAKFEDEPCCALVGSDGAGHFVKMVHNGIEYGIMQVISEAYVLLRDLCGINHADMAEVFRAWNKTELSSYLVEITADILGRKDEFSDGPLVEMILDKAGQKGTGRWSSEAALELGIPTPTITEAVFARALASLKDERVAASSLLSGPDQATEPWDDEDAVDCIRQALLGAVVATYAQGLAVIEAAGRERGWAVDLSVIADIWRDGCVIRAALLDQVASAYKGNKHPGNLMCASDFARLHAATQAGWRRTLCMAVARGVPVPGLSSALSYYDGYRSDRLSANMIQAQRDYFGAHTYERLDRPGAFHTHW